MIKTIIEEEIHTNIWIERRFNTIEKSNEKLIDLVRTLETNIIVYREDTKDFMNRIIKENENFRQEIRESNT